MKFYIESIKKAVSLNNCVKVLLALLIVFMPYGIKTLPNLLFLTFLVWFVSLFYPNKIEGHIFKDYSYYLLPTLAIVTTFSIIYSSNIYIGAKVLERLISFIIIPLLFISVRKRIHIKIAEIYFLLGITLFVSCLFYYSNFIIQSE